jgi:nicotinate-nucleotide adenylyltransferase
MRQVGLFGGSFDPVHQAHVEVVESSLHSGCCDEIWVLPSRVSPFKQDREITAFEHRYRMAQLAFEPMQDVRISDVEQHLDPPSYTLKTLHYLKQEFPDISWKLCIGSDNLASFRYWYGYSEILQIAELLVAVRPGYDVGAETDAIDKDILKHTRFVEHQPRRLYLFRNR